MPSDLAVGSTSEIEEERRLLYVAMTRAKDNLHMIVPQRFYAHQQRSDGDRHMYAVRTRFIPDTITKHFEQCTWPVATRENGSSAPAPIRPSISRHGSKEGGGDQYGLGQVEWTQDLTKGTWQSSVGSNVCPRRRSSGISQLSCLSEVSCLHTASMPLFTRGERTARVVSKRGG